MEVEIDNRSNRTLACTKAKLVMVSAYDKNAQVLEILIKIKFKLLGLV